MMDNNTQTTNNTDAKQSYTKQMQIRMQHSEQAGQPIYSNFVSTQGGQGIVVVDFGFLDPKIINALNQLAKSGEKMPEAVDARMCCRMAMNIETANNLAQQLNQLIHGKSAVRTQTESQEKTTNEAMAKSAGANLDEKTDSESGQRGFKLPWSK